MEKAKKDRIIHTAVEKPTWKRLALLAVERETTISKIIRQAIEQYLQGLEKPQ